MADEGLIEPNLERRRHGGVERLGQTIKDSNGAIARPWRGLDTLARMAAQGTITPTMHQAGERFHDTFRHAGLDGLVTASDPRRIPVLTASSSSRVLSWSPTDARWTIESALSCLGGPSAPSGSCAWHVLGLEQSLKEWARIYRWGKARGMSGMNVTLAAGILVGALGSLERHYGFKSVF
jgi:hypothetical protein